MDAMRKTILLAACAGGFSIALLAVTAEVPAHEPAEAASAQTAPERFRKGYTRWRERLQRHGLYVGRNLLPEVRASSGASRPPTKRELRRSIHRMQRRWGRWVRTTARGRAVGFKLKVRHNVPRWGQQHLRSIAWCESRNNPRAIGGGGAYRGMYQFTFRTWSVVGGSGDPAGAPRHEQTWRAWLLLSRHGSGHWPVCG
jgi:Transglycosylase-like domain